jgi:tetratricopeptide (TPR) repeat protein
LERGRWETSAHLLEPGLGSCDSWDAGAARAALANSLDSQSRAGGTMGAPGVSSAALEQAAFREYLALYRHAAQTAEADTLVRAGLLDWSRVYCTERHRDPVACPPPEKALRTALQLRSAALGDSAAATVSSLMSLAGTLELGGKRDEAEKLYRRVLPSLDAAPTGPRLDAAYGLFVIAHAGKRADAWPTAGWIAKATQSPGIEADAPRIGFLVDLSTLAEVDGRKAEAVAFLRAAAELGERVGGSFVIAAASHRLMLAGLLVRTGDLAAADVEYARAISRKAADAPSYVAEQQADRWREIAAAELERAEVLDKLGRRDEAARLRLSAAAHSGKPSP